MCIKCPSGLSDEEVLSQLRYVNASDGDQFELFNTTSVSHLAIAGIGVNGSEARDVAIEVLQKFRDWYTRSKRNGYSPTGGVQAMYPLAEIDTLITFLRSQRQVVDCRLAKRAFAVTEAHSVVKGTPEAERTLLREFTDHYPKTMRPAQRIDARELRCGLASFSVVVVLGLLWLALD